MVGFAIVLGSAVITYVVLSVLDHISGRDRARF